MSLSCRVLSLGSLCLIHLRRLIYLPSRPIIPSIGCQWEGSWFNQGERALMGSMPPEEMLATQKCMLVIQTCQMLTVSQLCQMMASMSRVCFHAFRDAAIIGQCHSWQQSLPQPISLQLSLFLTLKVDRGNKKEGVYNSKMFPCSVSCTLRLKIDGVSEFSSQMLISLYVIP